MHSNEYILIGFGKRLRSERVAMSMSQEDFGALGGVKRNAQIAYESEKKSPQVEYLQILGKHDVDVAYILTGFRMNNSLEPIDRTILSNVHLLNDDEKNAILQLLEVMANNAPLKLSDIANQASTALHEKPGQFKSRPRKD